jgi:hypothetical protein
MRSPIHLLGLVLALASVGCRLEVRERTGTAAAGDELALQAAVREIYRALASSDTAALDSAAVPAATVALPGPEQGDGFLVPLYTLWSVPGLRVGDQALRVVRTELHPDSHVAVVQVMVATRLAGALTDSEGSDWLTFVRREQGWSLVHAALGSWRGRSLP